MIRRYTNYTLFVIALSTLGCVHAPPTLSPQATVAFQNTRVIKTLDLLRDTAISANEQTPPLVSTEATRKIVEYHASTLKIMQAAGIGWRTAALVGLEEVSHFLPEEQRAVLTPYFAIVRSILQEVRP